jgi:hypothetical protein
MFLNKFIIKIYYITNNDTYFVSSMLILFYINLVKIQMAWLLQKRELHSFVDEESRSQSMLKM